MLETVGVRELRQNLSRYLERVKDGEALIVTERGREVARLVPSRPDTQPYLELAAQLGASVPLERLEAIVGRLPAAHAPAGVTDDYLAQTRRPRTG